MRTLACVAEAPALFEGISPSADMYPQELNQDGTTKHSRQCQMAFGRYDWRCHRCLELRDGRRPRLGWETEYFRRKRTEHQRRLGLAAEREA